MLIPLATLTAKYGITITGVIHVGAHHAEENGDYLGVGVPQNNIYWIDAIPDLCKKLQARLPNVINAAVSDTNGVFDFHITNNVQSSSLLPLKTHLIEHPDIHVIRTVRTPTHRMDDIVTQCGIQADFLNMDIQGAELKCLKGFESKLPMIKYIYSEVNERELYEGCALLPQLDEWLSERGFDRVETFMTGSGWGDAFYIRRTALDQ
jgi:FkbM family methyltransferase